MSSWPGVGPRGPVIEYPDNVWLADVEILTSRWKSCSGWSVSAVTFEKTLCVHQCCAWTRSMNDRSWTRSYFERMWTERTVFCLMIIIVNAFILAFVNGVFSQFKFAQDGARFPSSLPGEKLAKTHREQALICRRKTPRLAVVYKKDAGREVCATRFTFDQNET